MKKLILATPRGFCAGVDRAIHVVEKALEKFGSPIYVRHEIVHNRYVVETLKSKGVIFVDELDEVPEGSVVIFSAHGVADHIYQDAEAKHLQVVDATCPLVRKVHFSAKRHFSAGRHIILIGHAGHAEVEGTLGQLPEGAITLIRNEADIEKLAFQDDKEIAYITQTTLSVAETRKIIATLKVKFPNIIGPEAGDLCYATGNRQAAVLDLCSQVDLLLVVGAKNSSNSSRLMELGLEQGIKSHLIESVDDLNPDWFQGVETVGLSSGASAPEILVQEVVDWIKAKFTPVEVENFVKLVESTKFNLPKELQDAPQS
ncbi:MAG: 4-hydroxy-3-methylbut-2-enyl diphosphate reductase [Fibrobacter sp.]|nr:4-hydroxy-3-methylbut-2-enyl diphosphate reductase [Fibrobacter sp.]